MSAYYETPMDKKTSCSDIFLAAVFISLIFGIVLSVAHMVFKPKKQEPRAQRIEIIHANMV